MAEGIRKITIDSSHPAVDLENVWAGIFPHSIQIAMKERGNAG